MEDSDMLPFRKKVPEYPNYSLYVLEGGILKNFGGFSRRLIFDTEEEAVDYLRKKRYVAEQGGKDREGVLVPVLLVSYSAPYKSTMEKIL